MKIYVKPYESLNLVMISSADTCVGLSVLLNFFINHDFLTNNNKLMRIIQHRNFSIYSEKYCLYSRKHRFCQDSRVKNIHVHETASHLINCHSNVAQSFSSSISQL